MVRFLSHVDKDGPPCERYPHLGPCWLWTASLFSGGYGQFRFEGRPWQAHRWLYERAVGLIPKGLVLDHFACDTRRCVSPLHVRPVTRRENVLRDAGGGAGSRKGQTHCKWGHELTPDNLKADPNGWRYCLRCHSRRQQESQARKAQRAAGIR
jgi:hypothetical protein